MVKRVKQTFEKILNTEGKVAICIYTVFLADVLFP